MAKFTITISDEAHPILKEWAKKDGRSLTSYLTVLLDNITKAHPRQMYLPVEIKNEDIVAQITYPDETVIESRPCIKQTFNLSTPENPTGQSYTPTNQI